MTELALPIEVPRVSSGEWGSLQYDPARDVYLALTELHAEHFETKPLSELSAPALVVVLDATVGITKVAPFQMRRPVGHAWSMFTHKMTYHDLPLLVEEAENADALDNCSKEGGCPIYKHLHDLSDLWQEEEPTAVEMFGYMKRQSWDLWSAVKWIADCCFPGIDYPVWTDAVTTGVLCWLLVGFGYIDSEEPFKGFDT